MENKKKKLPSAASIALSDLQIKDKPKDESGISGLSDPGAVRVFGLDEPKLGENKFGSKYEDKVYLTGWKNKKPMFKAILDETPMTMDQLNVPEVLYQKANQTKPTDQVGVKDLQIPETAGLPTVNNKDVEELLKTPPATPPASTDNKVSSSDTSAPTDWNDIIARALMAIVPTAVGYGIGGYEGGAAGANAGIGGLKQLDEAKEKKKEEELKLQLKKLEIQTDQDKINAEHLFQTNLKATEFTNKEIQSNKENFFNNLSEEGKRKFLADEAEADRKFKADQAQADREFKNQQAKDERQGKKDLKQTAPAINPNAKKGKTTATGPSGGKPLNQNTLKMFGEANVIPTLLSDIEKTIRENEGSFGPVVGLASTLNPYDVKAQTIRAQMKTAAQSIGKYLEGGVLRKEDESKYEKMLPQLTDTPEVARNKMMLVSRLMEQKNLSNAQLYSKQGYDITGIPLLQQYSLPSVLGGNQSQPQAETIEQKRARIKAKLLQQRGR